MGERDVKKSPEPSQRLKQAGCTFLRGDVILYFGGDDVRRDLPPCAVVRPFGEFSVRMSPHDGREREVKDVCWGGFGEISACDSFDSVMAETSRVHARNQDIASPVDVSVLRVGKRRHVKIECSVGKRAKTDAGTNIIPEYQLDRQLPFSGFSASFPALSARSLPASLPCTFVFSRLLFTWKSPLCSIVSSCSMPHALAFFRTCTSTDLICPTHPQPTHSGLTWACRDPCDGLNFVVQPNPFETPLNYQKDPVPWTIKAYPHPHPHSHTLVCTTSSPPRPIPPLVPWSSQLTNSPPNHHLSTHPHESQLSCTPTRFLWPSWPRRSPPRR